MYHITFPPQSNRASWALIGEITDLEDNPLDLTGCSIVFQIRSQRRTANDIFSNYLTASSGNGKITIVDLGKFRWFFTLADMRGLRAGTYDTGLTLTNNDGTQTIQLSVGPLPIVDGVVP